MLKTADPFAGRLSRTTQRGALLIPRRQQRFQQLVKLKRAGLAAGRDGIEGSIGIGLP